MTIAILGTPNTAIDVETATVSYTAETGTNRLLVAFPTAEASGSRTLTSLSYGGTNGVIAAGRNSILPASLVYWLNANIAAGANDFAVTWSAFMSGGNGQSAAFTFSNVDQTNPLRNAAEAFGSGSPTAQNAEPGDMAVLLVANTATNVRYAVSGYTEHYDANRGGDHSVAIYTKAITTSGSEAPSITGGAWTDGVFMVLRVASAGSAPTISSVTPTTFANGQTGIVITGTGFGATQGAGSVRIGTSSSNPATGAVTQTVTAWSDTSITITAVRGSLATLTNHFLFVTNNGGTSNATGFTVQFEPRVRLLNRLIADNGSALASETDITAAIWRNGVGPTAAAPNPDQVIESVSTNGTGNLSLQIARGSLVSPNPVFLVLDRQGTPDRAFAGVVVPTYD